jgi:UDP-GlcNAc:undecaprenyl-phosphate/decaprenyl-phosphate GlcNAc-1-phosphate transferase
MKSVEIVLLAASVGGVLTLVMMKVCHRWGWLVSPRSDRWSARQVAQFGGVAIVLSFLLMTPMLPLSARAVRLVLLTAAMAAIGLWDDLRTLPPRVKFLSQFLLAGIAAYCGFIYPLRMSSAVNLVFTVLLIVGITNAFNLLDNMDGLAAGVGVITAVSILLVEVPTTSNRQLILAMAGALLGYLIFNFPPAKIFMGDVGSLALGFFLSLAFVASAQHVSTVFSVLFTPVLVLFLPIFDTVLVSVTRRLNGRAISAGAKDHSSHRLVLLGLSERNAVLTLYSICAISGLVALLLRRARPDEAPGLLALFLIAGTLFWLYLARIELPEDWLSRTNVFTLVLPEFLNSIAKRTAAILLDMLLLLISVYLAFVVRFGGRISSMLYAILLTSVLCLIVKAPQLSLFSVYHGEWEFASLRDAYPILKAVLFGSLIMTSILFYLTRAENFSRSVFLLDGVFTLMLLTGVRLAPRLFHDMLPKRAAAGCLLVGGPSALFFLHYFEWRKSPTAIRAVVDSGAIGKKVLAGVAVVTTAEAASILQKSEIAAVYILPDCPDEDKNLMLQLCEDYRVPVHVFQLSVDRLMTPSRRTRLDQSVAEGSIAAALATVGNSAPPQ